MGYYYLGLYKDFSCMAGDCPSTCCAGWRIRIDQEAMERFQALPDHKLRDDILQHVRKKGQDCYFANRSDGSCAMLDPDGLCRIQRNTEEQMLCVTCRKFPRLAGRVNGDLWMSMAASCPVVAKYLLQQPVSFYRTDGHVTGDVSRQEIPKFSGEYGLLIRLLKEAGADEQIPDMREQIRKMWNRYCKMYDIVNGCLEIMASSPELNYLDGSFDYFEGERETSKILQEMMDFEERNRELLRRFAANYLCYRVYSCRLEYPESSDAENQFRILGEFFLFMILRFSRDLVLGRSDDDIVIAEINWMYRFCVHGRKRYVKFGKLVRETFKKTEYLAEIISSITGSDFQDAVSE